MWEGRRPSRPETRLPAFSHDVFLGKLRIISSIERTGWLGLQVWPTVNLSLGQVEKEDKGQHRRR